MNEEEKSKKLDETLAFLAQKGMATIAQDTKLSNPKIKAILEKDFDSVQRVHAVGFVQILEKEYGVDLSQWLVEYDQNLFGAKKESGLSKEPSQGRPGILKAQEIQEEEKQKGSKPHKAKPTKSKQESQEPPKKQIQEQAQEKQSKEPLQEPHKEPHESKEAPAQEKPNKEQTESTQEYNSPFLDNKRVGKPITPTPEPKKSKAFFVLPAVLVVGLGAFFYLHHSTGDTQTINQEDTAKVGKPSSSNSSKDPNKEQATNTNGGDKAQESQSQTSPDSVLKDNPKDPTQAKTTLDATPKPTESKAPQSALKPPATPTITETAKATTPPTEVKESEYPQIVVTPTKGDLWMETIDLKTKHKSQTVLKEPFSFDTQGHSWLLAFGNGHLSIEAEGKRMDFNRDRSVRLLYTPKRGFVRLSLAHYKERIQ